MGRLRVLSGKEVCAILANHGFEVYPSRGEGFGLPPLEAMASALPVLAPATTGMREFVRRDTAILLDYQVKKGEYDVPIRAPIVRWRDLARKMRWAYENYNDTSDLRKNAAQWAQQNLTWGMVAIKLYNTIFKEVSSEKKESSPVL